MNLHKTDAETRFSVLNKAILALGDDTDFFDSLVPQVAEKDADLKEIIAAAESKLNSSYQKDWHTFNRHYQGIIVTARTQNKDLVDAVATWVGYTGDQAKSA